LNPAQCFVFDWVRPKRLPAFATAPLQLRSLPCSPQLHDNHLFFVLMEGTHDLPHEFPGRIVAAQVRFGNGDKLKSVALQIMQDTFLHHQISGKPPEGFDQHEFDVIAVQTFHHKDERRAMADFLRSTDAFPPEHLRQLDLTCSFSVTAALWIGMSVRVGVASAFSASRYAGCVGSIAGTSEEIFPLKE
jgi:hypothetical protein